MDETRGSFGGTENKTCAVPTFVLVVRKVLYVNRVGFWAFWLVQLRWGKRSSLWLVLTSDKSRKLVGSSLSVSLHGLQPYLLICKNLLTMNEWQKCNSVHEYICWKWLDHRLWWYWSLVTCAVPCQVLLLPNFAVFLIVSAEGGSSERESFFAYFYAYIQLTFLASWMEVFTVEVHNFWDLFSLLCLFIALL